MASTPCPSCQAALRIPKKAETGTCKSCGLRVRFVEVPERPCQACGVMVPLPPGVEAVRCQACGVLQGTNASRALQVVADCPRCLRRVEVPADAPQAPCPVCGAVLLLSDTF